MTYEELHAYLSELVTILDSCPYPNMEIVPDDQIIYRVNSILQAINFENDNLNFNPRRVDA